MRGDEAREPNIRHPSQSSASAELPAAAEISESTPQSLGQHVESDRAQLQRALEALPQSAVSEMDLHKTNWGSLALEFGLTLTLALLMDVSVAFVSWLMPPLPLKLYFLPALSCLAFGLAVLVGEILLAYAKGSCGSFPPGQGVLSASALWQAVVGKRLLVLETLSDVYIFAHCLEKRATLTRAFVEMVANPESNTTRQQVATIGGQAILPSEWCATAFFSETHNYTAELREAAEGELYPTVSQLVEGWITKEEDALQVPCYAELAPSTKLERVRFLWRHWAVRVCVNMLFTCFFTMPIVNYLGAMHKLKLQYCPQGKASVLPACSSNANDNGKTCKEYCGTLLSFMGEVGSRLRVEEIELIWTASLACIFVYSVAILSVRGRHERLETKFLLAMSGVTKQGLSEVVQVRNLLDESLSLAGVVKGLKRQTNAYFSRLQACEPLVVNYFRSQEQASNPCLMEVMRPVKDLLVGKVKACPLHMRLCTEEHLAADVHGKREELATWASKISAAAQELRSLKSALGLQRLQSASSKQCKFCVSVPITCREALELMRLEFFTKTGQRGYADPLDSIFSVPDCQDGARTPDGKLIFCHVVEDFRIGPLLVPAGVCLTHVCCETPDMEIHSLEVGHGKDIGTKEAFQLLFFGKDHPELNNSLTLDHLTQHYLWPPIMLPSAAAHPHLNEGGQPFVDSEMLAAKVKGTFVYKFSFVFQLSPSYFEALAQTQEGSDVSLYGFTEGIFARLGEGVVPDPRLSAHGLLRGVALGEQSWVDAYCTQCCLVAEVDQSTAMSNILHLFLSLCSVLGLVLLSAGFVMVVPWVRHSLWGGAFFPEPFTGVLLFNAVQQFSCLFCFLWLFSTVTARLAAIVRALATLEARTLSPRFADSVEKAKDHADVQEDPFRLYVEQVQGYEPTDPVWAKQFQQAESRLTNWHLCTRYLRVFVSGSRLTSQAVLVGAAGILLAILLVDLGQSFRGVGLVKVDTLTLSMQLHDEALAALEGTAREGILHVSNVTNQYAMSAAEAAVRAANSGRRLSARPLLSRGRSLAAASWQPLEAAQALTAALAPLTVETVRLHQRRLQYAQPEQQTAGQAGQLVSMGGIQDITQAQILTVVMAAGLLVYSWSLVRTMAEVNGRVEKHEGMLVHVKEQHRQRQLLRDQQTAEVKTSGGSTDAVEQAEASYSRLLDVYIQSAQDSQTRFPLSLFSFVITQALLIAWFCAAAQPLVRALSQVTPNLMTGVCQWAESTDAGERVEGFLQRADSSQQSGNQSILFSLVCSPLLGAVQAKLAGLESSLAAGENVVVNRTDLRRLSADDELRVYAVEHAVGTWWEAHPDKADVKLALLQTLLGERSKSMHKVFLAGREALRAAAYGPPTGPAKLGEL